MSCDIAVWLPLSDLEAGEIPRKAAKTTLRSLFVFTYMASDNVIGGPNARKNWFFAVQGQAKHQMPFDVYFLFYVDNDDYIAMENVGDTSVPFCHSSN